MKKSTIIGLFVFWVTVASVLTAGLVFSEKKASTKSDKTVLGMTKKENNSDQDIKLTTSEVAKHNSASDCWMIVSGKVYDFTSYMNSHPGGSGTIVPYCGKDGTSAFFDKPHSSYAQTLLPDYYIGDLNSTIPGKKSGQAASPTPDTKLKTAAVPFKTAAVPVAAPPPAQLAVTQAPQGGSVLTAADVAKHSSASDCWMIVSGKVYNVTSYVGSHPGGVGTISSYCGKDGTSAFYGLPHSQNAANILASYYIGDLGSATTQSPSGSSTAQTAGQVPAGSTVASQPSVQRGTTSQQREDDD